MKLKVMGKMLAIAPLIFLPPLLFLSCTKKIDAGAEASSVSAATGALSGGQVLQGIPAVATDQTDKSDKNEKTDKKSASTASSSPPNCGHSPSHFRCVQYVQNYDGDTITVNIPGVHPLIGEKISVRVLGVDTAEKNGHKPCEKQKAREAQRLVENLLRHAKNIELADVQRDKYFRILAQVKADGQSISDLLLKNKLAYSYDGGRKPANYNWCKR